jgi:Ser/Thr protein kinase RdoA (MazF antagonist)
MSATAVHSMGKESAVADWPPLQLAEVHAVLEHWGIPYAAARIAWHSPRPLSAAALIDLPSGGLFIKRHASTVRDVAALGEEHRFITHLQGAGAPVCRVLAAPDGGTAWAQDPWTYELHERGAGLDLYRDAVSWSPFHSTPHAQAAGDALARLHAAANSYDAAPRRTPILVSNDRIINASLPLAAIQELMERRPALREYLELRDWRSDISAALAPFHSRYLDLAPQLAPLWTHGDWHASNLLWSEASATAHVRTILDFGLCDRTSAVYDLATAIERNTIPWLDIHDGLPGAADLSQVTALLRGYLGARALSLPEREALLAILPIVHVGYALSEIDYFHGITHSAVNADLAYEAFLLGHCRWFQSAAGCALRTHVREQLAAS